MMTAVEALRKVQQAFPFKDYIIPECGSYTHIAEVVSRRLPEGSSIFDFGSGPCDKTAVLSLMGYRCSACDDLQDHWHGEPGNREKIMAFAQSIGIDFRLVNGGVPAFEKQTFDMVMLHDVLEHLHESPRSLLTGLLDLVKPEGYLFITVPNAVNIRKRISVVLGRTNLPEFKGYYNYPGVWRGHIREYVKDDLRQLAGSLGLDIIELHGCHHILQQVPSFLRPLYRMVTSVFPGWRDSWILLAKKSTDWSPRRD